MNDNWVIVLIGVGLVLFGWKATHVSGAMPGAKPLASMPLRSWLILIGFGSFTIFLGAFRLMAR